jgi:hypothetical protein
VGELFLPGEPHQVLDLLGLEELPDQQAHQQATVEVVALVLDLEDLEAALIVCPFEAESYPIPDHIAPSVRFSTLRDVLFMLLLDHFCRVNHINLVLASLAVNAY